MQGIEICLVAVLIMPLLSSRPLSAPDHFKHCTLQVSESFHILNISQRGQLMVEFSKNLKMGGAKSYGI